MDNGKLLPAVEGALIAMRSASAVSMRRAAELPWLLERRRDWIGLREVVTDLAM